MTAQWVAVALTVFAVIVIPLLTLVVRGFVKWSRVESKLDELGGDIKGLIITKDKEHLAILEEIRTDRKATDRRLRWLEEYLWRKGDRNAV